MTTANLALCFPLELAGPAALHEEPTGTTLLAVGGTDVRHLLAGGAR